MPLPHVRKGPALFGEVFLLDHRVSVGKSPGEKRETITTSIWGGKKTKKKFSLQKTLLLLFSLFFFLSKPGTLFSIQLFLLWICFHDWVWAWSMWPWWCRCRCRVYLLADSPVRCDFFVIYGSTDDYEQERKHRSVSGTMWCKMMPIKLHNPFLMAWPVFLKLNFSVYRDRLWSNAFLFLLFLLFCFV